MCYTVNMGFYCAVGVIVYTLFVALCIWGWNRFIQRLSREPRP